MMSAFSRTVSCWLLAAAAVHASVSFELDADKLKNASGTPLTSGTNNNLFLLVAYATGNFPAVMAGTVASVGNSVDSGGTATIVAVLGIGSPVNNGALQATPALDNATYAGDKLELLWFPNLTDSTSTVIPTNQTYGEYTDQTGVDGSAKWVVPASGAGGLQQPGLYFYTTDGTTLGPGASAHNLPAAGNAIYTVTPVPVPATGLLLLAGLGWMSAHRRRPAR